MKYIFYVVGIILAIGIIWAIWDSTVDNVVAAKKVNTVYINSVDTVYIENTDSIIFLNNKIDSLNSTLFIANYKLGRIKEYNEIAAKGNNIKYLRGWINRVFNE